jgi:hypothetical protein
VLVIVLVSAGLIPFSSFGQSGSQTASEVDSRTTTVLERARPELDPLGMKISGFIMSPSLQVGVSFNDNIFATQTNTRDDVIATVTPGIQISSDWNQHSLAFAASGDVVRYATNDAEDHETYNLSVDGRLDVRRDTKLSAKAGYKLGSEERGSVDDVNGSTPTEFDIRSIEAGIINKSNRLSLSAVGGFSLRDFDDAGAINNDDRDRDELSFTFRGGYEIQDQYEAFAQVILTSVNYDALVDDNGLNRDNEGYEIRAGARIDITGLLFGDVFVGYLNRNYDGATLRPVDTVVGGLDITWNVTSLTTIKAGFERVVDETTLATASGNLTTGYNLSVDHELLRSLILSARVGISTDEFEGASREDDYVKAGLGAKYLLNRNLSFLLRYDYSERDSNVAGADNETNMILLTLQARI